MRRTDQEFKTEVLRRSEQYQARRKQRRRMLLTTAACMVLSLTALWMFIPIFGGMGGAAEAAGEPMANGSDVYAFDGAEAPAEMEMGMEQAEMAEESITVVTGGPDTAPIELDREDTLVISAYLDGSWMEDTTNCPCDCIILVEGRKYRYHSECGTFIDAASGYSLTVSEDARTQINKILKSYTDLSFE